MTIAKLIACTLAAGLTCAATAPIAAAQDAIPSMNLRWAHFSAEAWGSSQADKLFAKEVEERTGGKVKAQFYWSGAMGGPAELPQLTVTGAVDVGSFVPSYYPAEFPLMSLVNSLPLTWDDPVLAMETQKYLALNNPYVKEELERNGFVPILFHGLAPYRLQCTKLVRKIEDIKGLRIRTFGDWPPYMFEKLGAIPVNVAMTEVYEGMQRGTLDCAYNSTESAGFLKLAEVAKYWSDINMGAIAAYSSFVGRKTYDAWPDELKAIMKDAADIAEAYEKKEFAALEEKYLKEAQAAGIEYVHFEDQDRLSEVVPNMLETWEKTMCDKGMCDAAKSVVADIRKLQEQAKAK